MWTLHVSVTVHGWNSIEMLQRVSHRSEFIPLFFIVHQPLTFLFSFCVIFLPVSRAIVSIGYFHIGASKYALFPVTYANQPMLWVIKKLSETMLDFRDRIYEKQTNYIFIKKNCNNTIHNITVMKRADFVVIQSSRESVTEPKRFGGSPIMTWGYFIVGLIATIFYLSKMHHVCVWPFVSTRHPYAAFNFRFYSTDAFTIR